METKIDGNVISPIYRWKKDANIQDVKKHLESLNSGIAFFEKRGAKIKLRELTKEKESLVKFYNL
jgi:hypothetical protein